jgi:required for meiotic nuclear division protein 1
MADALVPVRAFAVSATVQPRVLAALFAEGAERVRVTKTLVVVRYGPAAWAVAHDFGAVVFIGVEAPECQRVIHALVAQLGDEPRAPVEDTFSVEISPGAPPAVRFDRVVVPELDARIAEIIALVIAQSVAMEYYEGDVDALVVALEKSSQRLADDGALRGSAREMLRFIGRGMTMRSRVIHTLSLLESPAATWESERLDRLFRELRLTFEIEERYLALDHEIRIVQDNLALLVDLVRQRRSVFLEVTVAVFVVAETLLFLGQLLLEHR